MNSAEESIESPCIGNCCLDGFDICLGCFRTLEEIKAWWRVDEAGRHAIVSKAGKRKEERAQAYKSRSESKDGA